MRLARGNWTTELGLALIALAMALRVLIAPGFMPLLTDHGVTVSLCTAKGAVTVELPGKPPLQKAHDPCPYAALGQPPLAPSPPLLTGPLAILVAAVAAIPALLRPHVGAPAPPPPATGPPASA